MNIKKRKISIAITASLSAVLLIGGTIALASCFTNKTTEKNNESPIKIETNNVLAKKVSDTEYQLIATVYPEYNFNKSVKWELSFKDSSSEWAKGKQIADYITLNVDATDCTIANVVLKKAFGEQIIITCSSVNYPDIKASCTIDYEKKIEDINFYLNNDKNASNPYIKEGDKIKSDYEITYSSVYSLDKEYSDIKVTTDVYLEDQEPGVYITKYDASGKTINYKTVLNYLTSILNNEATFSTTALMNRIKNDVDADIFLGNENIEEKELYVAHLKKQGFVFRGQLYDGTKKVKESTKTYKLKLKDVTSLSLSENMIIF